MNATTDKQVFQSRWGYHPCSRETSKKLRFLNLVYQKALHLSAAWKRWEAKAPHNRVHRKPIRRDGQVVGYGDPVPWNEPAICPIFSEKITKKVVWHPTKGYNKDGTDYTYVETKDRFVPAAARQARTPMASTDQVRPLSLTEQEIDALYDQAVQWMASRKK